MRRTICPKVHCVLWFAFAAVALIAMTAAAANPYVGYIYPSGIQVGTTNRLVVGGQGFWGQLGAGVTGEGVKVVGVDRMALSAPPTSSQHAWLKKWLDGLIVRNDPTRPALPTNAAARVGEWTVNAWWSTLDQLDRRELEAVERDIYIRKNSLQMSPSLRQILFVDVVVDADAAPGTREFCVWTQSGISPPRPLAITVTPHVEEPLYAPPHRPKGAPPVVASFPVVLDGRIMPGETDTFNLVLRKGQRLSCEVTARELQPYVGDAVPGFFNAVVRLIGPDGREVAFADDRDRFRPDPAFAVAVPTDGTYRLELHDNLFRGREDFVYSVALDVAKKSPPPAAPKPNVKHAGPMPRLECGGEVSGCIAVGAKDVYAVHLKGPGTFVFDLKARRDGSSLDGVLTLKDAKGCVVWRQDDVTNALFVGAIPQAECDAIGKVTLADGEARDYAISVEDLTGHGGSNYGYRLALRREQPSFAVYAGHSSVVSRLGTRQPITMHVERQGGFTGPVVLLETEDFRFENGYIPGGTNEAKVIFVGKTRDEKPLRPIGLRAYADVNGRPHVVDVVPADECMQAFAWRHLLPARSFLAKNLPPWPPRIQNLKPSDTLTLAGSAATTGVVRNVRLFQLLRHPHGAPEVAGVRDVPHRPYAAGCRPLLLTPLPYDQYGDQPASNRWLNVERAAEAANLRRLSSEDSIALADLHEPLTQVLRERVTLRLCGEDRQSPTPALELLAAAKIFEALGAAPEVAHVTINAATRKEDVGHARIRDVHCAKTGVSFVYVARALPLPATAAYRQVDAIYPLTKKFNVETLAVKQLDAGTYAVRFDGVQVGTYLATELAKGVNVALLDTPGQRQAQAAAKALDTAGFVPPRPRPVNVEIVRQR